MSATPYGEGKALDLLISGGFVSLHTGPPDSSNEVTTGGYIRRALGAYTKTGTNPTVATNNALIEWPVASVDYEGGVNITHFGVWDAVSAGNMTVEGAVL